MLMLQITKILWKIICVQLLWQQFGEDPFLFQHDCDPVYKASSIKTWFNEFGVEELQLALTEPLWDELEHQLRSILLQV